MTAPTCNTCSEPAVHRIDLYYPGLGCSFLKVYLCDKCKQIPAPIPSAKVLKRRGFWWWSGSWVRCIGADGTAAEILDEERASPLRARNQFRSLGPFNGSTDSVSDK